MLLHLLVDAIIPTEYDRKIEQCRPAFVDHGVEMGVGIQQIDIKIVQADPVGIVDTVGITDRPHIGRNIDTSDLGCREDDCRRSLSGQSRSAAYGYRFVFLASHDYMKLCCFGLLDTR